MIKYSLFACQLSDKHEATIFLKEGFIPKALALLVIGGNKLERIIETIRRARCNSLSK